MTTDYAVAFQQHIRAHFEEALLEYHTKPVKCRGSICTGWKTRNEGSCPNPVNILFAWHFNDDRQGELNALCSDHEQMLIELANFTPNDFFLDVAEIVWTDGLEETIEAIKSTPTVDPLCAKKTTA